MSDTIDRQAAIDAFNTRLGELVVGGEENAKSVERYLNKVIEKIKELPPAQPKPNYDEWCTDCKEYDKTRKCCPRWNRVIRQTLADAQPEPCEDAVSRTEILRMINCINDHHAITPYKSVGAVTEHLTRIASSLPPVTPKRGKCKWCERLKERNLRIEYYWIDQEGCTASFSEPHIVATGIAKFCPNCGADMRGEQG